MLTALDRDYTLQWPQEYTTLVGKSSGEENTNLYISGVNEGRVGTLIEPSDILDVFGEDGIWS